MLPYIRPLFVAFLLIFGISQRTDAQIMHTFPDRAKDPRRAKALLEKRHDLFNARTFKGFFYLEGNYGLANTFSKDKVFTVSPPISLGFGYRFSSNISLGARVGQSVYNSDIYYYDRTFTTLSQTRFRMATANLNAHFPLGLRGEAYGGFGIGYQDTDVTALEASEKEDMQDRRIVRPQTGFFGTAQIGIRYALTPTLSVQSEISSGLSTLNVGMRYRIR